MSTTRDELEASVRELEAQIPHADPSMRAILEQQIQALRDTSAMLQRYEPHMAEAARHRPELGPELRTFFTPEPAAEVPAWIPDTITLAELHEGALRCPPEAQVYRLDDGLSCAIPGQRGVSRSVTHGLTLKFFSTGRLQHQQLFERGLLRWSIQYHAASGARESVGFYAATEPLTYPEHGLHTRYASNGVVIAQAWFWTGQRHGWSKTWEDDGFPIGATLYHQGREVETVLPNGERRKA
jgi:hypothetical protein